jgi:hypothetical protein
MRSGNGDDPSAVPGGEGEGVSEADEFDLPELDGDDEGGGEAADDPGRDGAEDGDGDPGREEEPAPGPRRPTQSQRWRERFTRQEGELAELRRWRQEQERRQPVQQQPQQPSAADLARQEQEERNYLEQLSPAEAIAWVRNRERANFQQALNLQALQTRDLIDKASFDNQAITSAVHARYRERVEDAYLTELRNGNLRATRADVLARLVGQDALSRQGRAREGAQRQGQRRIARETVAPGSGARSGVVRTGAGGGRRQQDQDAADEALLRQIGAADLF